MNKLLRLVAEKWTETTKCFVNDSEASRINIECYRWIHWTSGAQMRPDIVLVSPVVHYSAFVAFNGTVSRFFLYNAHTSSCVWLCLPTDGYSLQCTILVLPFQFFELVLQTSIFSILCNVSVVAVVPFRFQNNWKQQSRRLYNTETRVFGLFIPLIFDS